MRPHSRGSTSVRTIVSAGHPTVRRALTEFLASIEGASVLGEAAGDDETLTLVERTHPEVVVLDCDDALYDGWRSVRRIRQRSPGTRVVVVALDPAAEPAARAAGADVFLVKGCPLSQLAEALRTGEEIP